MQKNPFLSQARDRGDPRYIQGVGVALLVIGALTAYLLYFAGPIAGRSLPARAPYFLPPVLLAILGVGCLQRRRGAFEVTRAALGDAGRMLLGIVVAFALLAILQIIFADTIGVFPVLGLGVLAILGGATAGPIKNYFRGPRHVNDRAAEPDRTTKRRISFRGLLVTATCCFLLYDAALTGAVARFVERRLYIGEQEARSMARAMERDWTKFESNARALFSSYYGRMSDARPSASDRYGETMAPAVPITSQSPENQLIFPSTTGWPLLLGDSGRALWMEGKTAHHWDPGSNDLTKKIDLPFEPESAVETTNGVLLFADGVAALVTSEGEIYSATLGVKRSKPSLVVLVDQSVLAVGGIVKVERNGDKVRTNAVERIAYRTGIASIGKRLSVKRMPDLPGAVRTAFGTVALPDGRAMVLGGTDSRYVGCNPCTAETWFFDPEGETWSAGPKMNEARSDLSATALADGGVIVAGGWTTQHGWGGAGSRTVERWNPKNNAFVPLAARMASYMSMHRALWLPGMQGKQLMLAGGNSAAIQVYDLDRDVWRVVGEACQGAENSRLRTVIPFLKNDRYSAIIQNAEWCPGQRGSWELIPLRLPLAADDIKSTALSFSNESGIAIYRQGATFLPGQEDSPSLVLGGTVHAGMNSYVITSAVDAIWPDGYIQSLHGFIHARSQARLFRLPDGALLLAGGQTDVKGYDHAQENASSGEWLPGGSALGQGRWQPFEFPWARDVLGQMADRSLLTLEENGEIRRIEVSADAEGRPQVEASDLPPLPQPRLNQYHLMIRGLPDGRIVVAGGAMQNRRLSILRADSMDPDAADEYLRIGEAEPTAHYDIFEPANGQWRRSAASLVPGGLVAVYDDGRVVRLYSRRGEPDIAEAIQGMEISSADGRSWSTFTADELPIMVALDGARMFVLENELFVSGEIPRTGIAILQWFNGTTRVWETLWQSTPNQNWRENVGRIVIRHLGNGKRVVLPVAGL